MQSSGLLPSTAGLDAWSLLDQPTLFGQICPRVALDAIPEVSGLKSFERGGGFRDESSEFGEKGSRFGVGNERWK